MDSISGTEELAKAMERYAALYNVTREVIYEMEELEAFIKKEVRAAGTTITHGNMTAEWRKGSIRETWDGKGLNGYAAAHPEILQLRTVTESQASVSLKVKTV